MAKNVKKAIEEVEVIEIVDDVMNEVITNAEELINEIKQDAPEFPIKSGLTPKQLDYIFRVGDQGKTIRRYLRKYFADNHVHKTSWNLSLDETHNVIIFLTERFGEPDFTKLDENPEPKSTKSKSTKSKSA